ncbi:hypothetical protein NLJ89_g9989 [Agrocybe chaxingu]|uniref:Uncharacterized protein n=1 Tax=Agrocybe chaxingu TaxID=84603 RepID=A0A9W8JRF5_9AGAR|nr:hypothetical protein NLJ89_g9989 [Agrocybe chaxingu]
MSHRVVDEDLPQLYKLRELEIDAASTNPLSSISGAVLRALSLKTYAGGNDEFLPHLEVLSLTGAKDFGWSTLANIFPDNSAGGPGTSTPASATDDEISLVRAFRSVKVVCLASVFRTVDYIRPDDLCRLFAASANLELQDWTSQTGWKRPWRGGRRAFELKTDREENKYFQVYHPRRVMIILGGGMRTLTPGALKEALI